MKTVDFSETIVASELKGSKSRHLIKHMRILRDNIARQLPEH